MARSLFEMDAEQPKSFDEHYRRLSKQLNIRIHIYSKRNPPVEHNFNPYINALVINIYRLTTVNQEEVRWHALYHKNYEKIDPKNKNASQEIEPAIPEKSDIRLIDELIYKTLKLPVVIPPHPLQVKELKILYYGLKRYSNRKTWGFERKMEEFCKRYIGDLDYCELCLQSVHKVVLHCKCLYCESCINDITDLTCVICGRNIDQEDEKKVKNYRFYYLDNPI
jgi:hypothetical protein